MFEQHQTSLELHWEEYTQPFNTARSEDNN